jgi:hypothetical protein
VFVPAIQPVANSPAEKRKPRRTTAIAKNKGRFVASLRYAEPIIGLNLGGKKDLTPLSQNCRE